MNFTAFNLHSGLMAGIERLGYSEPTPIQAKTIPPALKGKDIIGLAQTGTGKTVAFALPVLQKLLDAPRKKVGAVIMTPTRELAEQVNGVFNSLSKATGLRSTAVYGGTDMNQQMLALSGGAEIVVACPGRLIDHLWRGSIDISGLKILVIDEADRMLDMGFIPDIRKIISCILQPHQTLMFSATMPANIRKLADEILNEPVTVKIGQTAPAETVSHSVYPVKQQLKPRLLMELLSHIESKSVLIFTRTKHSTERIARQLAQAGFKATSLQGDLSQSRRQAAIDAFRKGKIKILVATDIASRGIDILNISHVINYDMPQSIEDYIHRIGRTGRVNMKGDAMTIVTASDTGMIESIEKILKKKIERRTIEGFDYTGPENKSSAGGRRQRRPYKSNAQKRLPLQQLN
ncbi:MAG: DEAD/DEAH box helicase [Dehalococcoidales bacterium]|nr:DEAD/DEAH box helicase [Dehalococcoidales bacterium]